MRRADEYRLMREDLVYNLMYGPNEYPQGEAASFEQEFAAIRPRLVRLMESARATTEVTWLRLAVVALDEANDIREADPAKFRLKMHEVVDRVGDAASRRSVDPTMVVDSKGGVGVIKR